jgi:HD-GYP domain-containing protein (c-di-GMP phosphodiesterase class II)
VLPSSSKLLEVFLNPGASTGDAGDQSSEMVSLAFEKIVAEHRGLAEELLCVYEQLGIIFDVTRKLSVVRDEEAMIGLFWKSLQRSFAGRDVFVARPRQPDQWIRAHPRSEQEDANQLLEEPISAALRKVCCGPRARTIVVTLQDPHSTQNESARGDVLIGPVYSGDLLVFALVIVRRAVPHSAAGVPEFRASDMSLVESLATFCGDLIRNHRLVLEMREMSVAMVRSLVSAVDQKDQYTCGHSLRVGYYATTLGRLLNLPEIELQMLQWSALLHDVGKIGIRDEVLNKKGKLTPEEFQHIQEHPVKSHRVVQQVPQLSDALDGVLHHHERYDGSGYPSGLKGEEIPLQARIIQIADVFDALTSSRSYRPAFDWQKALGILEEEAGKTVDPRLQEVFDRHVRQRMQSEPQAWEKMLEKANHFASAFGGEDNAVIASLPIQPDVQGGDSP